MTATLDGSPVIVESALETADGSPVTGKVLV